MSREQVLTIAGFDPSGGAGVLADTKTFESLKVYGLAVPSALTWQNESEFEKVEWLNPEQIISQLAILWRKSDVRFVKIGLVENIHTLSEVVDYLHQKHPKIRIVWDPILKASAGFDFHSNSSQSDWLPVLSKLYLITPNWHEACWLAQGVADSEMGLYLAKHCHTFVKGGHHPSKPGYDGLYLHTDQEGEQKQFSFRPRSSPQLSSKHGSGCVLSAAITAFLARGYSLQRSCLMGKQYVTRFLSSNPSLLGYHK